MRRKVIRVQIMGNGNGGGFVEAQEIGNNSLKGSHRFCRFQVADVLADEDLPPHAKSNGVFKMRAHGQNGGRLAGQQHRQRRVTPRPAQKLRLVPHQPEDAIVYVALNGAIVDQKRIGDVAQALHGLSFVGTDGFVS
jgi:hypothetical protein